MQMDWRKLDLDKRILATLAFFDIFDYPLSSADLENFLLGGGSLDGENLSVELGFLVEQQRVDFLDSYYCLSGRSEIFKVRLDRLVISKKMWRRVNFFAPLIFRVPFLRMVAVCNSLALNNASIDSDIDLFVVAERGRIFMVRYFLTILLGVCGVRRHGKKIAGRFCLSFFVTETAFDFNELRLRDDIYLPYWIKTLSPLGGFSVYQNFLAKNIWVKQFFSLNATKTSDHMPQKSWVKNGLEFLLNGTRGDWLESLFRALQEKRHKKNLPHLVQGASVIVSDQMLKFHNIDRRNYFSAQFKKRLDFLKIF